MNAKRAKELRREAYGKDESPRARPMEWQSTKAGSVLKHRETGQKLEGRYTLSAGAQRRYYQQLKREA